MIQATPHIGFEGQAEEALMFYHSVFGGDLKITRFRDFGMVEDTPDWVMHGQLDTDMGWSLMASDNPGGVTGGSRINVCIWGDDEQRMTEFFNALAQGGTVEMPLEKQEWGDSFGGLRDRFGVDWGVNIGSKES